MKTRLARGWCLLIAGAALVPAVPGLAAPPPVPAALRAQVAAERQAIRLVARPDIRAARLAVAADWRRATPGLLPETYDQLDGSLRELVFMVALQVIDDDPRRPQAIEISRPPHRWFGTAVPGGRWGINNPDTLYFTIPIEPGSRYVITGQRHAVGPADANFTVQTGADWVASDNLGLRDLKVDADGTYRITIDDQPAGGRANHLRSGGPANVVLIRNTLADWSHERADTLTVARVAGPPPGPVPTDDELARRIIARLRVVAGHSITGVLGKVLRQPLNIIPQPGAAADKPGFLVTQRNTLSHFRLADDEALVATFDPGGAAYATFPVTNAWGVTPDSAVHQDSLNNRQAVPNADGSFTVVLTNRDPGIANWIDAAGLREGIVMLRWQLLTPPGNTARGPFVTARVVKRRDLAAALPAGIDRITPTERRAQLVARAAAFDRRFISR